MSAVLDLDVEFRDGVGKGAAKATRKEGYVPCVVYGGKEEPVAIKIQLKRLLKTLNKGGFMHTLFNIEVNNKKELVLPKALQLHPVKDMPIHVDFLRLTENSIIAVDVPVEIVGQEKSPGMKKGGALQLDRHIIKLDVPAKDIPEHITIDISEMDLNIVVHITDIALPKGCKLHDKNANFTVMSIHATRAALSEAEQGAAPSTPAKAPAKAPAKPAAKK
jgi:large subunit ribosomal protein L25